MGYKDHEHLFIGRMVFGTIILMIFIMIAAVFDALFWIWRGIGRMISMKGD